jgi:hypothetical protein
MRSFLYSFLFLLIAASPLPAFASAVRPRPFLVTQSIILFIIVIVKTAIFCIRNRSFVAPLKHSIISATISLPITWLLFFCSGVGFGYILYFFHISSDSVFDPSVFLYSFPSFLYPCISYLIDVRIGSKILKNTNIRKIKVDSAVANIIPLLFLVSFYIFYH